MRIVYAVAQKHFLSFPGSRAQILIITTFGPRIYFVYLIKYYLCPLILESRNFSAL